MNDRKPQLQTGISLCTCDVGALFYHISGKMEDRTG
jgi:hypothetical protein